MFNKLLSNVTVNPSSLNQFAFYAQRLKKEESIRRLGLVFVVLSMLVQIGATMFPAERSLAASSNDVIYGGVTSKTDLVNKCNNNVQVQAIYSKFGVSCAEINATTTKLTTINSSGNYWSVGRTPLSNHGISSDDWGERTLHAGGVAVYHRPLKAWSSGVNYEAFSVKSGSKTYWILKDCGNITTNGPEGPTPNLEIQKKLLTPSIVKPGDTIKFLVTYRNTVAESVAEGFRLRDLMDKDNLDFISMTDANGNNAQTGNISGDPMRESSGFPYAATNRAVTVTARVKASVPSGTRICNVARVSTVTLGPNGNKDSEQACVDVFIPTTPPPPVVTEKPCPHDPTLKLNNPKCARCPITGLTTISSTDPKCVQPASGICVASSSYLSGSNKDIKIETEASVEGNTKVESYSYDLDSDGKDDGTNKNSSLKDSKEFKGLSKGKHKIQVLVNFSNGTQKHSKTCVTEIDIAEDARLVQSKKVVDLSGNDLNAKKISSGDKIQFKLSTKNVTSTDSPAYSGEDYFGDVLEYAELSDMKELESQGISLGKDNYLRWSTASVKANTEEIKTISVKVKQIIPSTNKPVSTGTDQDCVISNKFGNQVSVNINCPLIKTIETVTTKLPDTGPGTTVGLAFLITMIAGYFLARSRLMNKEARIVKNMYQQAI